LGASGRPTARLPGIPREQLPLGSGLMALGILALAVIVPLNLAGAAPSSNFWARAEITAAAALAVAIAAGSIRGTDGRVRQVRMVISIALGLWLGAELVRNGEVAVGITGSPAPSDFFLAAMLASVAVAFVASLRGHVDRRTEYALYLDAAIVFFGVTAGLLTVFGPIASSSLRGAVDTAYVAFFVSTFAATLLLDLALRVERRPRGAYLILAAIAMLALSYVVRLLLPDASALPDAGLAAHLQGAGLILGALGVATWSGAQDDDPRYARLAERLRSSLPIVAIAVTPGLLLAVAVSELPPAMTLATLSAIGLVLITVAVRQSVLLWERDAAARREARLAGELAVAEAKYRALVERQPGIVYLAEPGEHGRWHYVSPQIQNILGYTQQEWLDDPTLWAQRIHPEDRLRVLRDEAATSIADRRGKGSSVWEYRMLARDGREVWILDDESVTQVDAKGQVSLVQGVLLDISERKRTEEALRVSEEQTRRIIESASYAFIGMGSDGTVLTWNQHAANTFGWTREQALGRQLADLIIPAETRAEHYRGLAHYLATGEGPILSKRIEVTAVHRDGHEFPVEMTIWPVRTGDAVQFSALVDDITVRKALEGQLRHQALHDALTGLPNRVLFSDRLQHALDRSKADSDLTLAVFFVDLDDFKTVNDSLGHTAGDQLLAAVADRLRGSVRGEDTAARLGGDEFAVLVEDGVGTDHAHVADRILRELSRPFDIDGQPVSVQASIGISLSGPDGSSPDELLRNADLAMYLAKARGKNRHELYTPGMHEQVQRRLDLKRMLESAVEEERLEVDYQPVVALSDGSIVGLEALLRWREGGREVAPASEVIPLAEETGLIVPIGRFVLNRAFADLAAWREELGVAEPITMAVNLSPVQLENGTLVDDVERALVAAGITPRAAVLELTESALMNDSLDTVRTLRELRGRGVRIALDDFGTGYSSLARLRRFSVDVVKIDHGFVAAVGTERGDPLIQSIIDLGRSLGMEVVAEGIETRQQLEGLRRRGAQLGQGYYFARPVPAAAIGPMLTVGRLPLNARARRAPAARGA
jgi:diguanylate cyclase (GGDEF)-like protein/PAS domain S-box-containing protein